MSRIYDTHKVEYADAVDRAESEDHDRDPELDGMTLHELCRWMRGPSDSDTPMAVDVGTDHEDRIWSLTAEYQRFGGVIEARTVFLMDLPRHSAARVVRAIRARACI